MLSIEDDNRVAIMALIMHGVAPRCSMCEVDLNLHNATVVHDHERDLDVLLCPTHGDLFRSVYDPIMERLAKEEEKQAAEMEVIACRICGQMENLGLAVWGDEVVTVCEYHATELNTGEGGLS